MSSAALRPFLALVLIAALSMLHLRCAALQELQALSKVDFSIDRVAQATLAGVLIDDIRSYDDLNPLDILKVANAIRTRELPMAFTLHLTGENPASNNTQARMVQLDWTLFLNDRETISGIFNDDVVLPPGSPVDIPISMRLDLISFFGDNARDLIDLALAVSGKGGSPQNIRLSAQPTINTPIGPIRYPGKITIVSKTVG